jgi:hypothetical protein
MTQQVYLILIRDGSLALAAGAALEERLAVDGHPGMALVPARRGTDFADRGDGPDLDYLAKASLWGRSTPRVVALYEDGLLDMLESLGLAAYVGVPTGQDWRVIRYGDGVGAMLLPVATTRDLVDSVASHVPWHEHADLEAVAAAPGRRGAARKPRHTPVRPQARRSGREAVLGRRIAAVGVAVPLLAVGLPAVAAAAAPQATAGSGAPAAPVSAAAANAAPGTGATAGQPPQPPLVTGNQLLDGLAGQAYANQVIQAATPTFSQTMSAMGTAAWNRVVGAVQAYANAWNESMAGEAQTQQAEAQAYSELGNFFTSNNASSFTPTGVYASRCWGICYAGGYNSDGQHSSLNVALGIGVGAQGGLSFAPPATAFEIGGQLRGSFQAPWMPFSVDGLLQGSYQPSADNPFLGWATVNNSTDPNGWSGLLKGTISPGTAYWLGNTYGSVWPSLGGEVTWNQNAGWDWNFILPGVLGYTPKNYLPTPSNPNSLPSSVNWLPTSQNYGGELSAKVYANIPLPDGWALTWSNVGNALLNFVTTGIPAGATKLFSSVSFAPPPGADPANPDGYMLDGTPFWFNTQPPAPGQPAAPQDGSQGPAFQGGGGSSGGAGASGSVAPPLTPSISAPDPSWQPSTSVKPWPVPDTAVTGAPQNAAVGAPSAPPAQPAPAADPPQPAAPAQPASAEPASGQPASGQPASGGGNLTRGLAATGDNSGAGNPPPATDPALAAPPSAAAPADPAPAAPASAAAAPAAPADPAPADPAPAAPAAPAPAAPAPAAPAPAAPVTAAAPVGGTGTSFNGGTTGIPNPLFPNPVPTPPTATLPPPAPVTTPSTTSGVGTTTGVGTGTGDDSFDTALLGPPVASFGGGDDGGS